jgi:hypothetical protein
MHARKTITALLCVCVELYRPKRSARFVALLLSDRIFKTHANSGERERAITLMVILIDYLNNASSCPTFRFTISERGGEREREVMGIYVF